MKVNNKELAPEVVSALVLMCIAVDNILMFQKLTLDIIEELEYLRPQLDSFILSASCN